MTRKISVLAPPFFLIAFAMVIVSVALVVGLASSVGGDAGSASPDVPLKLAWRFAPGDEFMLRESREQQQLERLGSSERAETTRVVQYNRYRVREVDADGVAALEVTFVAITLHAADDEENTLLYDSRVSDDAELAGRPGVRPFAMMVGRTVRFHVAPDGLISDVDGYADIFDSWLDESRDEDDTPAASRGATFSDEFFAHQLSMLFRPCAGRVADVGDSWTVLHSRHLAPLGTIRYAHRYTLDSVAPLSPAVANVSMRGAVELIADDQSSLPLAERTSVKMSDSRAEGTLQFDRHEGRLLSMTRTTTFDIEIRFGALAVSRSQTNIDEVHRLRAAEFRRHTQASSRGARWSPTARD